MKIRSIRARLKKLVRAYMRNIEDTHKFYNVHENGDTRNPRQCLKNNRFLVYSHLLGYLWKPAFYGSVVLSLFDRGEYNSGKLIAMTSTSPALITGTILFGAFWSRLGSRQLLEQSWRERVKQKQ